ncbi:S-layer homology domain-containing protein [Xylanibacillus composti]|uniref:SLH domain-containing protein n=1 Tax=Xylanibacillus composti TaxID=1572762 RepID=A0A8J4H5D6_9BACL|nr:S-layer homology domain-containing protein [Xylanibacillus composti]GIQ71263.1 hypothetical protein XYCOK13_40870 [Xylanibacillus composti]
MKKTILTKTASSMAAIMLLSLLLPILAFAGAFFGDFIENADGTVTGDVYFHSSLGIDDETNTVSIAVYSADHKFLETVTSVTYSTYRDGYYHFSFDYDFTVSGVVYDPVYFKYFYPTELDLEPTVSRLVYKPEVTQAPQPPRRNTGGGGGGGVFSSVNNGVITLTGTEVSASDLEQAFKQSSHVVVKISGDTVLLPVSAMINAPAGATITIEGDGVTYTLPLAVFDFDQLADSLGVDVVDMKIKVEMKKVAGSIADAVAAAVEAAGAKAVADTIEFKVSAEGNGNSVAVNSFGNTYVSRTISLNESVDAKKATGVVFNPSTNKLSFVPSTFSVVDGNSIATLKRNSNSIYTVITLDNSFSDVPANHYAADDITLLANKLIVSGVSDSQFEPNRSITRAEFAALVVRSLGLPTGAGSAAFMDISANAWYAPEVAAAVNAGIIYGYEDNTFRPNNAISREELAAMVVRALAYAGKSVELTAAQEAQALAPFQDASELAWSRDEVAVAVREGIVYGMSETSIDAKSTANRAQAAAMLKRYLDNVGFID